MPIYNVLGAFASAHDDLERVPSIVLVSIRLHDTSDARIANLLLLAVGIIARQLLRSGLRFDLGDLHMRAHTHTAHRKTISNVVLLNLALNAPRPDRVRRRHMIKQ